MSYENQDDEIEGEEASDWVSLGTTETYEAFRQATHILHDANIESIWGHDDKPTDELRRVLEPWPSGGQIYVEQPNFNRALALVGNRLSKPIIWTSLGNYLASRPTDELFRIIDLRDSWKNEVISATEEQLNTRGQCYPPDGVNSRLFPAVCLLLSIFLGIFAGILRLRINKSIRPATGGTRPYYNQETRRRSERMLMLGFSVWLTFVIVSIILRLFFFRPSQG